jgi:hypothetical protein
MHYSAIVIVPGETTDIDHAVAAVMQPYREDDRHGFWDWYQIGGRWTGLVSGYDPTKDPDNIEVCWICQGSGMRTDRLGQELRAENPAYTCNGCNGTGRAVKWPTEWAKHPGDIASVADVISSGAVSFAVIPYNGPAVLRETYHAGIKYPECFKDTFQFDAIVTRILFEHESDIAIVVDYHS